MSRVTVRAESGLCSVGPCVLTFGGAVGSSTFEYSQSVPSGGLGLLSLVLRDTSSDLTRFPVVCALSPYLSVLLGDDCLELSVGSACPSDPCGRSSLPVSDFRAHGFPRLLNLFSSFSSESPG